MAKAKPKTQYTYGTKRNQINVALPKKKAGK